MRRVYILQILICLSLSSAPLANSVKAQMPQRGGNQASIIGWTDDTHYQIKTFDSNKNPVIQTVDILSGKKDTLPSAKSPREILSMSLPEGITLSTGDVLSPDMKSVVINKDNDLYFFSIGDKELKRITNDKITAVDLLFCTPVQLNGLIYFFNQE